MFKKIPGNHSYEISLNGEIRTADGSACTLNFCNDKVQISLYGEERLVDLGWLALLADFDVELPEELTHKIWNISFTDRGMTKNRTCKVMLIKNPIVIDKYYRVIPGYTDYAVSRNGMVISIFSKEVIPFSIKGSNDYLSINIPRTDRCKRGIALVHRLVALAWIENNQWMTNFIVNHKDGNKLNPDARNLEWVSYTENAVHAFKNNLRNDCSPCKVRDIVTKTISQYFSISEAVRELNATGPTVLTNFLNSSRPRLFKNRYELKYASDETPWFFENIDKPIIIGRYTLIVTYPDGTIEQFHDVRSLIWKLKLWNIPSQGIWCVKEQAMLRFPGMEIKIIDRYNTKIVQALNIATGDVTESLSFKKLAKATGVCVSTIKSRLKLGESYAVDGYAFRYKIEEAWCKDFTIHHCGPVCILATNSVTKEQIEFKSLRNTAVYFNLDRKMIKARLDTGKCFGNWAFKEIQ